MNPTQPRFRLIIFDLDGTLIDAFEDIALAANFVRRRNNLSVLTVNDVKQHVGHGARHLVEGVLGPAATVKLVDENLRALVGFYEELKESRATVYNGVLDTLRHLRTRDIYTAVASNKPHTVTLRVVAHLGLDKHFDVVRGEAAEIRRKPAPDVLLRIMDDVKCSTGETLMVGDTEIDIKAARAAGVQVAAVTYGQHSADYLSNHKPDYMLEKMPDLLNILN